MTALDLLHVAIAAAEADATIRAAKVGDKVPLPDVSGVHISGKKGKIIWSYEVDA